MRHALLVVLLALAGCGVQETTETHRQGRERVTHTPTADGGWIEVREWEEKQVAEREAKWDLTPPIPPTFWQAASNAMPWGTLGTALAGGLAAWSTYRGRQYRAGAKSAADLADDYEGVIWATGDEKSKARVAQLKTRTAETQRRKKIQEAVQRARGKA